MPITNLIFDLGVYDGRDSRYYLSKGFRVVGVEASPIQAKTIRETFSKDIQDGQFILIDRAIWSESDRTIPFFLHGEQSSISKEFSESYGRSVETEVRTTTIRDLFSAFGVPHYLKCDLEGADRIVLQQLLSEMERPTFLSVEAHDHDTVERLCSLGYNRFQIVNQQFHDLTKSRTKFELGMTGPFGNDLRRDFWLSREDALAQLVKRKNILRLDSGKIKRYFFKRYGKFTGRHWLIPAGWLDIHACREDSLSTLR